MQYIYSYAYEINLFKNEYNELENMPMFNETLKLYKNFKNVINFKLRNRDRVSMIPENKSVKISIVDEYTELVVTTFYLSPEIEKKNLKVEILPEHIEDLGEGINYTFMASLVDANDSEEILYVDHDFEAKARVKVIAPYRKTKGVQLTKTTQRQDNFDKDIVDEYYFDEFILKDRNFIKLEFGAFDSTSICDVLVQKNKGKYVPARTDENVQWDDYKEYFGIGGSSLETLELGKNDYYRIVIKTATPEQFYLIKTVIDR